MTRRVQRQALLPSLLAPSSSLPRVLDLDDDEDERPDDRDVRIPGIAPPRRGRGAPRHEDVTGAVAMAMSIGYDDATDVRLRAKGHATLEELADQLTATPTRPVVIYSHRLAGLLRRAAEGQRVDAERYRAIDWDNQGDDEADEDEGDEDEADEEDLDDERQLELFEDEDEDDGQLELFEDEEG